ncbi:hypothetical protein, partial [Vibrio vulnificus]|uniref:hypothetical protein n=1 Tax=Vibrio vulnificus TaxID=672 RepID=UPI0019D43228
MDVKKIYKLVKDEKQPLYPGCEKFLKLGFTVRLYLFKCLHGVSEAKNFGLLELIREDFPHANMPKTFYDAKNVIKS